MRSKYVFSSGSLVQRLIGETLGEEDMFAAVVINKDPNLLFLEILGEIAMLENRCCSTGENEKVVVIEYLYLDLNTCGSCAQTEDVLESVLDELRHAFKIAGYDLEYHKVLIETAEMATAYRFLSSPTIRVNGRDIWNLVKVNNCGCSENIDGYGTGTKTEI